MGKIESEIVKQLTAILFSLLLALGQFTPAQASPACAKPAMKCGGDCGRMDCCAAKPASDSQPAVPAQSNTQNQIIILAPAVVIWNLPQSPAILLSSVSTSPLLAVAAPLYARNCSLLL